MLAVFNVIIIVIVGGVVMQRVECGNGVVNVVHGLRRR